MDTDAAVSIPGPKAETQKPDSSVTLLDHHEELACRWQADTTLTYVNNAYCRYFGKSEAELLGQSFLSLIPEEERAAVATHFQKLVASFTIEHPFSITEHRVVTPSGQIQCQEWINCAIYDQTGRLAELQSLGRNITTGKHAQEALQQTQRTLETLISNLSGLVYRCRHDENWTMEFASEGCLELTGYSSADFVLHQKVSFQDLVHPDDLDIISVEMDAAIGEKRPFEIVYRIITANGEEKWVWEQGQAVFEEDGDFSALEGFITDITETKQAELTLWEMKEKAQVTLASIGDAVITTDPDGLIEYMNPIAESLTGYCLQEAEGRRFTDICQVLSEQNSTLLDSLPEQSSSSRQQFGVQGNAMLLNRNGVEYAVESTVSAIRGPDRKVRGIITVYRDVSDARRLQRHLAHQATHDSLTGLVNRYEFEERLQQLLMDAREAGTQHALCYLRPGSVQGSERHLWPYSRGCPVT